MGPKKNSNKQSSISVSNRSSASAGLRIKKATPSNLEDYMEETDDVNRDALVTDVGTHIPATEASFEEEEILRRKRKKHFVQPLLMVSLRLIQKKRVRLSYQIPWRNLISGMPLWLHWSIGSEKVYGLTKGSSVTIIVSTRP